ncbi:MAG: multicopper oxidase family protein [Polyangiaceae bacterium]|nr:multicopper oxidase family protein [Polyangiaceae bacterium]
MLASACGGGDAAPSRPALDAEVRLTEARDLSPDPRVVEVELEAKVSLHTIVPGAQTPLWTYDGGLPGPLLRARVGDRVIVHFRNSLPAATTVHWHGVRVPAAMDGAPFHSQPPVEQGGEFTYDFVVPDAGLFWYHPHVDSAAQVGFGLYGPLLVEAADEPPGLGDEVVLVLSDLSVRDDGSIVPPQAGGNLGTIFGREGDTLLVNGRRAPTLHARAGQRLRLRLVNAARSRYFQLALAGHTFTRIGGDGGLTAAPVEGDTLVLAPGERADALLVPRGAPGETLTVRWTPFDRGYGTTFNRPDEPLFRVALSDEPAVATPPLPAIARAIAPLDAASARPRALTLTQTEVNGVTQMGIDGVPSWLAPPLLARTGELELFTVTNATEFAHPFHLHGFFFQVLDDAGAPRVPLEWKDTVSVPVHGAVRLLVRYDDRPGDWMFHCHILDHAEAGMMGVLSLSRP